MTIIDAIRDREIFRPHLGDLRSWQPWSDVLRMVFGLQLDTGALPEPVRETRQRLGLRRAAVVRLMTFGGAKHLHDHVGHVVCRQGKEAFENSKWLVV